MIKHFFKGILFCSILFSCTLEVEENFRTINVVANRQATGTAANDLLSDVNYKKMIIEIGYLRGFKPTETALNNLKSFIEKRTYKPEGLEFVTKEIPSTGKTVYTLDEIVNIEKEYRTKYNTNTTIAVWALFVNGKSSRDNNSSSILGTAYWNTSFVIYEETIHGLSDSAFEPKRSILESTVINHEFGHLLGLTNLGTNLQSDHEDIDHPKHCSEEDCLMYWSAESSQGIGNLFSSGQVPTLDAQCLADLKANGGE